MKLFPINRERYFGFVEAKGQVVVAAITSWPLQFIPFSPVRTETDSCVIGNGIPKSGTYLINRIIEYFGKWENSKVHINSLHWNLARDSRDIEINYCFPRFAIRKLQNGQLVAAHLPWSKGLAESMRKITPQRRIKHVFLYRDPRDTFISYMNFVTYSKKNLDSPHGREEQKFMVENFSNDDDRLLYIIEKKRNYKFAKYAPWLSEKSHCLAIKFEDLYLDVLKTKDGVFGEVLNNLFCYLEVDKDSIDPVDFFYGIYNKGRTSSMEEDKLGQYKRYFKDSHYKLLDNASFRNTLSIFQYEW